MEPSQELKDLSIANSPKPNVSAEGQAAAGRIAAARAARDNSTSVDNTTITPDSLKPQAVISVPEVPQANQLGNIADQAITGAEDAFTQQQALAAQEAEQTKDTSLDAYLDSIKNAQGVAQLTQQASVDADITGIESELNNVNDLIRKEKLALRRATERIGDEGGGLAGGASAEVGNLQRESFAKQADLSLIQLAAQGKYDSAKAAVDRVVDAKLEQQRQFTESLGVMYQDAKDTFTTTEQREFETLLGNRNRALSEEKEKQTAIYDLALQAQLDGAPTDIVQAMMAADSRDAAMAAGGSYIGRLDRQQKEASIRSSNASAAKSNTARLLDLAEAGDQSAIAELGLTMPSGNEPTADEIAYANQYAATGAVPAGMSSAGVSFGDIAELAADLPKPQGAIVDRNTNVASSKMTAGDKASFDALYNAINTDLPAIQAAWDAMNTNQSFAENAEAVARGEEVQDPSFGTGLLGGVQSKINPTEAMTTYETAVADFTAKLVLARSGAAATDAEVARYQALLPGTFNTPLGIGTPGQQKLTALQSQMGNALNDKLSTQGLSIYGYSEVETPVGTMKVGEIFTNEYGQRARINPDGSVTPLTN